VLADPCPEPLSGASNVGGIAASTSEFIDYTRHQLSGQAVLEPKERTDGVRIGKGRKKIDLRVEGAKGRDEGFDVFRRVVVIERSREVEGQLRNRGSFGDIGVHSIKESCRELFKELERIAVVREEIREKVYFRMKKRVRGRKVEGPMDESAH